MKNGPGKPEDDSIELVLHNIHDHGTEIMDEWTREVAARTGGRVRFKKTSGENPAAIQAADIVRDVPAEPGAYPLLNLIQVPFIFPSATVGSKVIAQLYMEYPELRQELSDVKVVGLGIGACMAIFSSRRWGPIKSVEDFQGARTRSLTVIDGVIEALGGRPERVGFSEIAGRLESGSLDATVLGILPGHQFRLAEGIAPYCTLAGKTSITMHPMRIYMKRDAWNSLPQDIRDVIDGMGPSGAGCWFAVRSGLDADKHLVEALEYIKAKGRLIELGPEELERWHRLARPHRDAAIAAVGARGLPARQFFDRMNELAAEYEQDSATK
jgi:TRAP-type C4-dicarboxylate transport system substrate-binding protein